MQLQLLASTFLTVFVAELGDKTQLTIVTISGTSNNTLAVFLGSAGALVLASLLGALAGGVSLLFDPAGRPAAGCLAGVPGDRQPPADPGAAGGFVKSLLRRQFPGAPLHAPEAAIPCSVPGSNPVSPRCSDEVFGR